MHRRFITPVAAAVFIAVFPAGASARDAASAQDTAAAPPQGYPARALLSTGKTVLGETIRYPRTGPAHVTAAIVTLAPGGTAILHKHGAPLFAYILEGELTVDYGAHGKRTYRKGDSLIEAMGVAHSSVNNGTGTMRLIGVYMGAKGTKDVIPVAAPRAPATPAGRWLAESIREGGVINRPQTVLDLAKDGRVSGTGGCNRMTGRATVSGDTIGFGPLAGTKMACAPAAMEQEAKFFAALQDARRWRIDPVTRKLTLLDANGAALATFARMRRPR